VFHVRLLAAHLRTMNAGRSGRGTRSSTVLAYSFPVPSRLGVCAGPARKAPTCQPITRPQRNHTRRIITLFTELQPYSIFNTFFKSVLNSGGTLGNALIAGTIPGRVPVAIPF
jgi:hypothetical protein